MTETDITPTVLLTGPTSGIGAKILEALAAHPSRPSLVLMGRDPTALERAAAKAGVKGPATRCLRVDLGDLDSVRGALERLTEVRTAGALGRVDVAILNAGSQFTTRRKAGPQGYESTFTTNVISQHLLLRGLERQLAPGGHVVLMGSSTHRGKKASFNLVPDPEWADPADLAAPDPSTSQPLPQAQERERGGVAYATSKLALVTLSHDWAARLGEAESASEHLRPRPRGGNRARAGPAGPSVLGLETPDARDECAARCHHGHKIGGPRRAPGDVRHPPDRPRGVYRARKAHGG